MATEGLNPDDLTEEQLRAAYEQEIKRVRVEHVLLENVVTIVNLGMRRTGLMPGTEDERDLAQVQLAIESVRALMPQIETVAPEQVEPIRQALSQLQMAFVQGSGATPVRDGAKSGDGGATSGDGGADGTQGDGSGGARIEPQPQAPDPAGPGPAQSSGRLWIPGQ
jgi:hypothetical protein